MSKKTLIDKSPKQVKYYTVKDIQSFNKEEKVQAIPIKTLDTKMKVQALDTKYINLTQFKNFNENQIEPK